MANKEENSKELYDGFLSFEAGVNTNVAPFLLPKNQLGGAINASMRGTFVSPRAPYQKIALTPALPQALWQGACYYKPDYGPESLVCSIGGRLFQITPNPVAAATAAAITLVNAATVAAAAAATAEATYQTAVATAAATQAAYIAALNAYSSASSELAGQELIHPNASHTAQSAAVTAAATALTDAFNANQSAQTAQATALATAETTAAEAANAANAATTAEAGINAVNPIVSANVTEITIPGDPNPAQTTQAWLWQSEKWVITNDGTSIPIISNLTDPPSSVQNPGSTVSRRSLQQSAPLNTISEGFTAPGNQNNINVTLTQDWTGGNNVPVVISSGPAQSLILKQDIFTASPVNGALVTLQTLSGAAGGVILPGSTLYKKSNFLGFVTSVSLGNTVTNVLGIIEDIALFPFGGSSTSTYEWNITYGPEYPPAAGSASGTVQVKTTSSTPPVSVGSPYYNGNPAKDTVVGTTESTSAGQFIVPPKNTPVVVALETPYNGNVGDDIFIGSLIFQVTAINNNVVNVVTLTQQWDDGGTHPTYSVGTPVYSQTLGDELPPGRMGVYGMGQTWMSLPDGRSFICSDIVGYFSGTQSNDYRDAVFKVTQNTNLANGGNFRVPQNQGEIEAFAFCANLDVSLGQGPLQVLTDYAVYTCSVALGFSNWASVNNPILTQSLIANGATSQYGTDISNSDIFFRSPDGVRSLILGRRDFNTWGNVPISMEVIKYLQNDNPALLQHCSTVEFDNRRFITCNPQQGSWGVYHNQFVVINYDPLSNMQGKKPSIWEGVWTDLNVLQFVVGRFSGTPRCFAFHYNLSSQTIELWEILPSTSTSTVPIVTTIELPVMDFGEKDPRTREFKRLQDGELYIDQIVGSVGVVSSFRPDYDSTYRPWSSFTIPAAPSYQPRVGLDKPPQDGDAPSAEGGTGRMYAAGFSFQPKLQLTGKSWRLMGGRFMANRVPQPQFPPNLPNTPPG